MNSCTHTQFLVFAHKTIPVHDNAHEIYQCNGKGGRSAFGELNLGISPAYGGRALNILPVDLSIYTVTPGWWRRQILSRILMPDSNSFLNQLISQRHFRHFWWCRQLSSLHFEPGNWLWRLGTQSLKRLKPLYLTSMDKLLNTTPKIHYELVSLPGMKSQSVD